MVLTPAERARFVIRFLMQQSKKSQAELAQELGYSNATVLSQILNGKKKIPRDLPNRISALDPRINIAFLTGESDEMLLPGPQLADSPRISASTHLEGASSVTMLQESGNGIFVPSELVKMITDLSTTIKDQQKMITLLVEKWVND